MAMALVDLCIVLGLRHDACAAFVEAEAQSQAAEDEATLKRVEATRVDMETF
jgi:alpha-D-ribose 1-methylphosphonate 5-triphosphate synthase subunit PhnG